MHVVAILHNLAAIQLNCLHFYAYCFETILQLTVFRKFFVSLNLPLKIIRGEIIVVQAIVFNYFDQVVKVGTSMLT